MIVTLRLIRNFEHKIIHYMILKDVDGDTKVGDFKEMVTRRIRESSSVPPPFRREKFDTLKIFSIPGVPKENTVLINTGNDESLIMDKPEATLKDYGVIEGTEISFFNMEKYLDYVGRR